MAALQKERLFFFVMALVVTGVAMAGFLRFLAIGRSDFGAPWYVHVHGVTMLIWLGLYVAQNGLVVLGRLGSHRSLGMVAAGWSLVVVVVGAALLAINTAEHRTPPFFTAAFMIALDMCCVLAFAGLTWSAILLRGRADWHKRLMLAGTIALIQPGLGRLLPGFMLGGTIAWYLLPGHVLLLAIAMAYDLRTRGRVHPAYVWSLAVLFVMTALPGIIAPDGGPRAVAALSPHAAVSIAAR